MITAAPSDSPPVRYQGRIWVRVGPRRAVATAQDERILNERRRHGDKPFDVRALRGSSLSDLVLPRFQYEYLPAAVAEDVLKANNRTVEEQLAATKMVHSADTPVATVLGILVLGREPTDWVPGAWAQFLRVQGTHLADPIVDARTLKGTVSDVIRRVEEKLEAHNVVAVEFAGRFTELRRSRYALDALQQLVRNAFMHRSYEGTNAPVRVYWYDDRIEIISPGGPYGAVTERNFGQPGIAEYRNPNLAEAMRALGLVQGFGAGIMLARQSLARNGNPPPEFDVQPTVVIATVRPAY